jgi:hypothetical protein
MTLFPKDLEKVELYNEYYMQVRFDAYKVVELIAYDTVCDECVYLW